MKIHEFVSDGSDHTFLVEQSVHELRCKRQAPFSILTLGLVGAFPEVIDMECTNQRRPRIQMSYDVPLHDLAAWAEFGKGDIQEIAPYGAFVDAKFGSGDAVEMASMVKATVGIYVGDKGPFEVSTDDKLRVTIKNPIPGAKYTFSVPEQPVLALHASECFVQERAYIAADTPSKPFYTTGYAGMVLPYLPSVITRVNLTYNVGQGQAPDEREYDLDELIDELAKANPTVALTSLTGSKASERVAYPTSSLRSGLLVLDFASLLKVELFTVLGQEVRYTLFKVLDRNTLG